MHHLDTLYKYSLSKNSPEVDWGHRGQKAIFTKNASSTDYMVLHGMVM